MKNGHGRDVNNDKVPAARILAISPKRNSERKTLQNVSNEFRQQNRSYDSVTTERIQAQLDDSTFARYASVSGLFFALWDKKCRDGGDRKAHMAAVEKKGVRLSCTEFFGHINRGTISPEVSDKLELIGAVWETLSPNDTPVTEQEKALLDVRLQDIEENPDDQAPWSEVKARLNRKLS